MLRRVLVASCCTLAVALPALAGGESAPYVPNQRSAHEEAAARANDALRAQIRSERRRHDAEIHRLTHVLRFTYGTDRLVQSALTLAAMTYGVDRQRMAAITWRESRWRPWAINPSSGACGLAQWIHSTWMSTPQGKAGMDCKDPLANVMAMAWMARYGQGGWHHWDV